MSDNKINLVQLNTEVLELKQVHKIKKELVAKKMGISGARLSFYLKYGDIPEDRYSILKKIIKKKSVYFE